MWPSGVDVPVIWPALLAASLLAWTQALTWMPYALPGLRVIVTVLWLAVIDAVVLLALHYKAPEPVMLAILAPHVPLAYLAARFAVARARRGDVPDWRGMFARLGRIADVLPRRRERFPSPARAQVWFEWRRHGRSLPALVGILLPFELALLFVFSETPAIVFEILVGVLLTPPFMAAFVAATVSKSNPHGSDSYGVTPFIATRPLTSASLIAAKLKATIWSTLAAWLLVLVAIPVALRLSGTSPLVIEWTRHLIEVVGTPRAIAIVLLGFSALLASTWKQLVQSLYIGMSGREWVVKASVFVALSFLAIIVPLAHWVIGNRVVMAALWNAFPGSPLFWSASKYPPLPGSPCASMTAGCSATARSSSARPVGMSSPCSRSTACSCGFVPALLFRGYFLALVAILGSPAGATLRGTAGARVESASVTSMSRREDGHRRGADSHQPAGGVGPDRGGLFLRPESEQRLHRLLGPEAGVPALCPEELRPRQADAARHQHARRGGMAGPANGPERVEPAGREPGVHRRLPVGNRGRRAQGLARGEPEAVS